MFHKPGMVQESKAPLKERRPTHVTKSHQTGVLHGHLSSLDVPGESYHSFRLEGLEVVILSLSQMLLFIDSKTG